MIRRIAHAYRSSFAGLSRPSWLLSIVLLINRAGTMAVPFMSLYVTVHLGRSLAEAGLIITLFGVGSVLGTLLGGILTDRIGFRSIQIITSIVSGLLFVLYGHIQHFGMLCSLTVVISMVAEALRPANHAAIAFYSTPQNLTRSYTLNRLAINIGWAIGGAAGGFLAAVHYMLLFWVEGITNILVGVMVWLMLPPVATTRKKFSLRQKPPPGTLQPWQDGLLLRFVGFATLFTTAFFLIFRLVPVFWKEQWGLGERTIGALLGLNGIIIALLEMVLVKRWDARGPKFRYIIYGALACAFGYAFLLLPFGQVVAGALLFMIFITLGEMLALPFISSFIMGRATEANRGMYATTMGLSWSVAQIIGPSGGGYVAEIWGFTWLWIILILLCLLTALGFWRMYQHEKRQ